MLTTERAGDVYLHCVTDPATGQPARLAGHAGHYLGFAELGQFDDRQAEHRAGRGAKFTAAVLAAGLSWDIIRVWSACAPDGAVPWLVTVVEGGVTEATEKYLKELRNGDGLCPRCSPGTRRGDRPGRRRYRRPRPVVAAADAVPALLGGPVLQAADVI